MQTQNYVYYMHFLVLKESEQKAFNFYFMFTWPSIFQGGQGGENLYKIIISHLKILFSHIQRTYNTSGTTEKS